MKTEHRRRLRELVRTHRWAALATVERGQPLASMVAYAPVPHLSGFLLHLSRLAPHTGDLLETGRASLAISQNDPGEGDPQTLERVSVLGPVHPVTRDGCDYAALRACYLEWLPTAEPLFGFSDSVLFRLMVEEARYVGGFGQVFKLDRGQFVAAMRAS
jgi:putative heme iron utilization protein